MSSELRLMGMLWLVLTFMFLIPSMSERERDWSAIAALFASALLVVLAIFVGCALARAEDEVPAGWITNRVGDHPPCHKKRKPRERHCFPMPQQNCQVTRVFENGGYDEVCGAITLGPTICVRGRLKEAK